MNSDAYLLLPPPASLPVLPPCSPDKNSSLPGSCFLLVSPLAIKHHREPQRRHALTPARRVEEPHTPTPLLPTTLLEQETHRLATRVTRQDSLEATPTRFLRKSRRSYKLVPRRRVVPRAAATGVRGDAPHVGLDGGAGGDLVGVLQGWVLDLEHAAGRAGGDVGEGYDGDVVVGGWGAGAGEVEDQAFVRVVGVAFLEDVDVGRRDGGAGTGDEGCGLG